MWEYFIAIAILVVAVTIYILSYHWNKNTKKPEGCEDLECSSCKADDCAHRK